MAARKASASRPVVVTTAHRGVFVGHTTDADDAETIRLTKARMVVYWAADSHGVLGVATRGVGKGARLSPAVDAITLRNVTAVMAATPEAVKSWDTEPWG